MNAEESVLVGLERLRWEVDELRHLYRLLNDDQLRISVYPEWDVLDVLRHLVWWHESFAAVVEAAAHGMVGDTPRGSLTEVNSRSVVVLRGVGVERLLRRLRAAEREIERCHLLCGRQLLEYRHGSRRYTFSERAAIAVGEMNRHRHDVLRALIMAENITDPASVVE